MATLSGSSYNQYTAHLQIVRSEHASKVSKAVVRVGLEATVQ